MSDSLRPMDYSPPGFSVHGILQARMEWVAMPSSKGSSQPRDRTHVFYVSCICRRVLNHSIQFSSVTQSCPTLCNPKDCSTPGFPVLHQFPKLVQTHVHWVGDPIQPSHPLSSPSPPASNPSQYQSFFQQSVLHIMLSKYWSFSFSISPSNEYSGLISFRIDWLDLLAVH